MSKFQSREAVFFLAILVGLGLFLLQSGSDLPREALKVSVSELSKKRASLAQQPKDDKPYFELIRHKRNKVQDGLNLVPVHEKEQVLLLDMDGKELHSWPFDASRARLLPNCNLLVVHGSVWGNKREPWKDLLNRVREYDWEGNLIWEYVTDKEVHHDAWPRPDGSVLFLENYSFPFKHESITDPNFEMVGDVIREVSRGGEVQFEWIASEHLDTYDCGWKGCHSSLETQSINRYRKDWTHGNTAMPLPENKWHKAGDKRFKPGNVLYLPRNLWSAMIIDRDSGDIVWKYEGEHEKSFEEGLIRGHEANMIEEGLPGAGNILIFDNGSPSKRPYSRVLEISPPTKEIVWKFENKENFFSRAAGSVQRLENGNTLISSDHSGNVFEVTPSGEEVWRMRFGPRTSRARRYPASQCKALL